jgi:hypothetical protein
MELGLSSTASTLVFWLAFFLASGEGAREVEALLLIFLVLTMHPTYDFQVGDLVFSGDSDPFWLAEISIMSKENLDLIYWYHSPHKPGKRLIWKKHHTNGACRKYDVYIYIYVCSFWPPLVGLLATTHDSLFRTNQRGRSE